MRRKQLKPLILISLTATLLLNLAPQKARSEKRNLVAHPRTPYQLSFYKRHNPSYRVAGALHFAHSKLHDVLLTTPFERHAEEDANFYEEVISFYNNPPRIEPTQEFYAPYTARATWRLFRTIDSVHLLHEMTEDIMADPDIAWNEKEKTLQEAYQYYRSTYEDIALSPAPLDVTMRRAGVMMKPYFSLTRNYYPKNNNFFYAAHWWHPAVYESMMVGGNDREQDIMMEKMDEVFRSQVIPNPPKRMLLSREASPRYSRLSPETANTFDNLHMLHGITYDIFAYDGWTIEQKKAELYRVLEAMSYQPGDETLVRKFTTPKANFNPLVYDDWVTSADGAMSQIMMEMLDEMMPVMMSQHSDNQTSMPHQQMSHQMHQQMQQLRTQLKLKLTPGIQEGEIPGSFMDAMMVIMPEMEMSPEAMQPGVINPMMTEAMLKGWREKYGNLPDLDPLSMDNEPSATAFVN
ncbi:MAG: hypothetical protein SAJ37_01140 [Oscillatoria sp. PMC 1068.18]|nr:hypothetical protein [Oscillatoria sp. PMC 1076.18]MEC4987327.1 hypothetical protein [Oscillatoria sp. PMC 1068.18]